jgi:tetratricopeptide (TPR) repeat protein
MTPGERKIRDGLQTESLTPDQALKLVKEELASGETASLLVLRGILTQLSDDPEVTIEEAQVSFERAIALAPDHPEAYEELAHFFDAVMPDREKAERLYRLALAKGAGASCREALDELLAE